MTTTKITITTHAQLNALVAEKVCGIKVLTDWGLDYSDTPILYYRTPTGERKDLPTYSTDLSVVFEVVVEKFSFVMAGFSVWRNGEHFTEDYERAFHGSSRIDPPISAPTLPLAICLAALQQEGVEVELDLGNE